MFKTCFLLSALGIVVVASTFGIAQSAAAEADSSKSESSAQQSTVSPGNRPEVKGPEAASGRNRQKSREELEIEKQEQSQKMLGIVPQYGVTSRQNAPPLTSKQKLHLMVRSTLDPFEFAATGFQAAVSQAENEFSQYGQGTTGFAKRYGASYADQATSNFFSGFAYPVLFKEDPRYFRLGTGSIPHRIVYSFAQEFSAIRDTDHHREFNYSSVLGALTSGAISNAYYPAPDRGFSNTLTRTAIALAYGSIGGLADEFWPDIHDRFVKKKKTSGMQVGQK